MIFGRSMGSGPACFLAGTFKPGALMIMSGYASIRRVAGDLVGWLKFIVKEQFDNVHQIARVSCPTFILHGEQDEVIGFHHAQQLRAACTAKTVFFVQKARMTHNHYKLNEDLLRPLANFFNEASLHEQEIGVEFPLMKFRADISAP